MSSSISSRVGVQLTCLTFFTGLALLGSPRLHAQGESILDKAPDNLELSIASGLRFEDSLVVDSLDVSSPKSDFAAVGMIDLAYKDTVGDETDIRTGYVFEQRRYRNERDFDLQLHYGFLDLSREVAGITAGSVLEATDARLGGASLLNKKGINGYVADLVATDLYVRAGLGLETTDLSTANQRDSNSQRLDASAFYFLDGTRQYLTLAARYKKSDATDPVFDYDAQRITIGYADRVILGEDQPFRVRADWRYEARRYDEPDPSLGDVRRHDDRQRWRLRLDTPVNDTVSVQMKLEHRRYDSNNRALDFNDNRIELMIEVDLL